MVIQGRHQVVRLTLLSPAFLAAQFMTPDTGIGQVRTLVRGDLIRVKPRIEPDDRVTGSFVNVADDSLSFSVSDDIQRISLSDIEKLQVSVGKGSHLKGTLFGGVVGAVGGLIIGATTADVDQELRRAFVGFWGGAGIGAGLGWALLTPEEWVTVPIDDLRVTFVPGELRFQIGL